MSTILIYGKIFQQPQVRQSKNGNTYATCKVREGFGDNCTWWHAVAFGDQAEELAGLQDGEGVAISGQLKVETYEKNGKTNLSYSVTADRLLSAHRKRKPKDGHATDKKGHAQNGAGDRQDDHSDYDQALPFDDDPDWRDRM